MSVYRGREVSLRSQRASMSGCEVLVFVFLVFGLFAGWVL